MKTDCNILAKSDGTTLEQHIADCLRVWSQLRVALPALPAAAHLPGFWQHLFVAVYIHDFGKAHHEFQKRLQGRPNYWENQRHEIYSVPFAEKYNGSPAMCLLIKCAVLGHHKTFGLLKEKHKNENVLCLEYEHKWRHRRLPFHPQAFIPNLTRRLNSDGLVRLLNGLPRLARRHRLDGHIFSRQANLAKQVHPVEQIAAGAVDFKFDGPDWPAHMAMWGALKICDHYASAGCREIKILRDTDFDYLEELRQKLLASGGDFYTHQHQCAARPKHCILIAPTGAGKTESAMLWLRSQIKNQGRAFYILPYTASINAMHKRLSRDMPGGTDRIGIQHGNVPAYLAAYIDSIHPDLPQQEKNAKIKMLRDQHKRLVYPLKIVTPFQLLKFLYGVKGFEMGLVQMAGAKLIFDEIHAYDPVTFAQILVLLEFAVKKMHCSVMVMTATLPGFLFRELQRVLDITSPVQADVKFLTRFKRHRIKIRPGEITHYYGEIVRLVKSGKKVIVACNTVQRAQSVYRMLSEDHGLTAAVLLHGRFNARDRMDRERDVFAPETRLLVGTQVIEVSLDINFDVLFTEPAPLDALLQRAGRINRNAQQAPCPLYITKRGSDLDGYIYPPDLVDKTLQVLDRVDVLGEQQIQELLDRVYPGWPPKQKDEFEKTQKLFRESLQSLQPYMEHRESEEKFYEQFSSVRVLPAGLLREYRDKLENFDFMGADRLLVGISKGMYHRLKAQLQTRREILDILKHDDTVDRHHVLVAKCRYDPHIGMTDEREEEDCDGII